MEENASASLKYIVVFNYWSIRRTYNEISEDPTKGKENVENQFQEKKVIDDYWTEDSIYLIFNLIVVDPRKKISYEVVYPDGTISSWNWLIDYDFSRENVEINPVPAKTYPYKLDPFQRKSIDCLERKESVLVSAHTSAGKTAIAEYAIAMSMRDHQRVIYTSPIKALSNQKYRDLEQEFSDVGLMTGDITINPNATILVMTTEILRSMLYKGSDILREVLITCSFYLIGCLGNLWWNSLYER